MTAQELPPDVDDIDEPEPEEFEDDAPARRPFAAFLQGWDGGTVHQQLTDGLAGLLEAVKAYELGGSIVLTIEAKPLKNTDQVRIAAKVVAKMPMPAPRARAVWVDDVGNPCTADPRQMALPVVAAVPTPAAKPRAPRPPAKPTAPRTAAKPNAARKGSA